jgi:type IV secretory pathway VirJ component
MVTVLAFLLGVFPSDTVLIQELPLVEARVASTTRDARLAVIWSGDGDWAGFVRGVTRELNASGVSVVGLKSRSWLTQRPEKNADLAGQDLSRILRTYLTRWNADSVLLIGYSRGADLLPFAVSRLPTDLRRRVGLLVLVSPAVNANFGFHWIDLLSNKRRPDDLELAPEVRKLAGTRILCIYGTLDRSALCPELEAGIAQTIARDSGHHMEDAEGLARLILERWGGH